MVMRPPDLDQLRVFLGVVEAGSFSAAARKLGRAQSAVTYAIQELEADLGLTLFDRSAYEALGAPADMVIAGTADLCLVVAMFAQSEHVERRHAGWLDLAAVCAPEHPLARLQARTGRVLSEDDVVDHLQLVLTDRFDPQPGRDHGVSAARTWRLADLGAKRALLVAGTGWGSLPRHMIDHDVAAGRLVELRLERWAGTEQLSRIELAVGRKAQRALGPAGIWLFQRLSRSQGSACSP